jgi:hypothetical protein
MVLYAYALTIINSVESPDRLNPKLSSRSASGPFSENSMLACLPCVDCALPTRGSKVVRAWQFVVHAAFTR